MTRVPELITYADLPREVLLAGAHQRAAVRGDNAMITFNWMDPAMQPQAPHSHDFDQISLVPEGTMRFHVADQDITVQPGQVLLIPAGVPHTAIAVGPDIALNIDIFAPPRADYLHLVRHQDLDGLAFPAQTGERPDDRAVERLLYRWADALDRGQPHVAAELLTDDAVVTGLGEDLVGRAAFNRWADARTARRDRRTRHHVTNIRCGAAPDGAIAVQAYLILYVVDATDPTPHVDFVGQYDDVVVQTPTGLRFAQRSVTRMS